MNSTSASLLKRLRQPGEDEAWSRFVRLFTPLIFHVARRSGLSPDDASDLVQDVFVILSQKMPDFQYDPNGSFRGWLRAVTLNKLRENARRKRLTVVHDDVALGRQAADEEENVLEEAEYRQILTSRALELMRAEFSPTTWQACWEHVVSGRTAAEVGAELGISEGAVYVAKSRVLRRLREELAGML